MKQRESNIELFRCVLMMMIIYLHLLIHGVNGEFATFNNSEVLPTTLLEALTAIFCMVAVNCYVIISGYFGINIIKDGKVNYLRLIKTYLPILIYSIVIASISYFRGEISNKEYLSFFFPVFTRKWWFATCYIILCFISPFLNFIIDEYWNKKYLIIILIGISLFTYFFEGKDFANILGLQSLGFSTICLCYCIGRIIFKYRNNDNKYCNLKSRFYFLSYVITCLLIWTPVVVLFKIFGKNYWFRIATYVCPATLLASIFLFLAFINLKIKYRKLINIFGTTTFGIYLIHEDPLVRPVLYKTINAVRFKQNFIKLFFYLLFAVFVVFVIFAVVDIIRISVSNLITKIFIHRNKR